MLISPFYIWPRVIQFSVQWVAHCKYVYILILMSPRLVRQLLKNHKECLLNTVQSIFLWWINRVPLICSPNTCFPIGILNRASLLCIILPTMKFNNLHYESKLINYNYFTECICTKLKMRSECWWYRLHRRVRENSIHCRDALRFPVSVRSIPGSHTCN